MATETEASECLFLAILLSFSTKWSKHILYINNCSSSKHDLQCSRITCDETDIKNIISLLQDSWLNPFNPDLQDLVCLSTGKVTSRSSEEEDDLLRTKEIGKEAYKAFREQRLKCDPPNVEFHDTNKKAKLKTFTDLNKKIKVKASYNQSVVPKAERRLFAKMILIAESRNLQMSEVLAHPVGPLPGHWLSQNGTLRKTNRASLSKEIQKNVQAADVVPQPSACLIDGMALVQRLKGDQKTWFAQIAESLLSMALNEGTLSDRYDVTKEWPKEKYANKLSWKTLTCGREAYLPSGVVECLTALDSSQEEVDTRLLLHAVRSKFVAVIIVSEDTDVLVLCLAFKSFIPSFMFIKCSSQTRVKYLDVSRIVEQIGASTCRSLPGFYAFTGCDTGRAFQGQGKVLVFRIMAQDQGFQEVLQGLGREWQLSNELYPDLQRFTCAMYCKNAEQTKSTTCDTSCSAWRKGMLIPISYLPVATHFTSMHWELIAAWVVSGLLLSTCTCIPCVCCSAVVCWSIFSGLFSPHPYPPLFPMYIIYQCDVCPSSPLRWGSWLGCQDLPAMGAVSSRSWLLQ